MVGEKGMKEDNQNQEKPVEKLKEVSIDDNREEHVIRVGSLMIFELKSFIQSFLKKMLGA